VPAANPELTPNTEPPIELAPNSAVPKPSKLPWQARANQDGLIRITWGVHDYLKQNGVPHVWHVDSNAHDTTDSRKERTEVVNS